MRFRGIFLVISLGVSGPLSASESDSESGAFFIRDAFSNQPSVGVRWDVGWSELSVSGGFDRQEADFDVGTRETTRYRLLGAGRWYAEEDEGLRSFWDLELGYWRSSLSSSTGPDRDADGVELGGYFGLEYRFSDSLGLEGRAGVVYETGNDLSGVDQDVFEVGRANVSLNYYW